MEDGEETRTDNFIENEEKEDVIDLNEIEVEQQKDAAAKSVIDDCMNLEVGKNDNIEIKTDCVIEKEEKEDVQQPDVAEISVIYDCLVPEVEKNDDMEIRKDDVIEKKENEDIRDLK